MYGGRTELTEVPVRVIPGKIPRVWYGSVRTLQNITLEFQFILPDLKSANVPGAGQIDPIDHHLEHLGYNLHF